MDAPWRIEMFGGLHVCRGNQVVHRYRRQAVASLLAFLAYHPHRSHPRTLLIELLWPESDLDVSRNRLSVTLTSLRRHLEPPDVMSGGVVLADRASVQLNPAALTTDVAAFESALRAAARTGSVPERIERLTEAAELYRGELLPGFFDDWVLSERERQAEAFQQALGELIQLLEGSGDLPRAVLWARRAVSADPLRETSHALMIRLLAAMGQNEAARRQYQELERLLEQHLGEEPSSETRDLVATLDAGEGRARRSGALPRSGGPGAGLDVSLRSDADRSVAAPPTQSPAPSAQSASLPSGTVTFLMTDIEGSTRLWEGMKEEFRALLARHHELLREVFRAHGGCEVKELGDGFLVAFARARDALACAVAAQKAVSDCRLKVRMALHTGDIVPEGEDYHGLVLHHTQRVLATGHGGQILCTEATAALLRRDLPPEVRLADLGVYRLRDVALHERLFQVEFPGMAPQEFPPLKAATAHASNLPMQFTRFFGRQEESARLVELLRTPGVRLVTLIGPGGTGKTRLAFAVAEQLVSWMHGAVWFVPLADLTPPQATAEPPRPAAGAKIEDQIAEAIRDALRLPPAPEVEPLTQVVAALSNQPALLLLDNLEQVADAGASLIQTLLERLPMLTCLLTSRQRLGLPGELEFPVLPLPVPAVPAALGSGLWALGEGGPGPEPRAQSLERLIEYPSVQLFVDRAQAVRPDFQVTTTHARAIAELCARLEGIPLALELAAARVGTLTPTQIAAHLAPSDRGHRSQRFELLARRRGAVPRHQSLRAALDWSYQLLDPELGQLFLRLSVFSGGFSLDAAEALSETAIAIDALSELRDCSLVLAEERGGTMRYRLLETIREYAAEKLHKTPEVAAHARECHARYFRAFAEAQVRHLHTAEEGEALSQLEAEVDNLRSAMDWARGSTRGEVRSRERSDRASMPAALGLALGIFLQRRGSQREALERTQAGLEAARQAQADVGANLVFAQGEHKVRPYIADLLRACASVHLDGHDWRQARERAGEAALLDEQLRNARGAAEAANLLGLAARGEKEYAAARRHFTHAREQFERIGDRVGIAMALNNLGRLEWEDEGASRELATLYLEEALRLQREIGDTRGVAWALNNLGVLVHIQGDLAAARCHYEEALRLLVERRDALGVAQTLCNLGEVAEAEAEPMPTVGPPAGVGVPTPLPGERSRAYRLLIAAEALFDEVGSPLRDYAAELRRRVGSCLEAGELAARPPRGNLSGSDLDDLVRWSLELAGH